MSRLTKQESPGWAFCWAISVVVGEKYQRMDQFYCSVPCRHKAKDRRKRERQRAVAIPAAGIELNNQILKMQTERDKRALARLFIHPYLNARAEVLEAEQQLKAWTERLHHRRATLSRLFAPEMSRHVVVVSEKVPLPASPDGAIAYGASSTDGLLGVVVFGAMPETRVQGDQ